MWSTIRVILSNRPRSTFPMSNGSRNFNRGSSEVGRETLTRMTVKKVSTTDADSDEQGVSRSGNCSCHPAKKRATDGIESTLTLKALQIKAPGCPRSELPGVSDPAAVLPSVAPGVSVRAHSTSCPASRIASTATLGKFSLASNFMISSMSNKPART